MIRKRKKDWECKTPSIHTYTVVASFKPDTFEIFVWIRCPLNSISDFKPRSASIFATSRSIPTPPKSGTIEREQTVSKAYCFDIGFLLCSSAFLLLSMINEFHSSCSGTLLEYAKNLEKKILYYLKNNS